MVVTAVSEFLRGDTHGGDLLPKQAWCPCAVPAFLAHPWPCSWPQLGHLPWPSFLCPLPEEAGELLLAGSGSGLGPWGQAPPAKGRLCQGSPLLPQPCSLQPGRGGGGGAGQAVPAPTGRGPRAALGVPGPVGLPWPWMILGQARSLPSHSQLPTARPVGKWGLCQCWE